MKYMLIFLSIVLFWIVPSLSIAAQKAPGSSKAKPTAVTISNVVTPTDYFVKVNGNKNIVEIEVTYKYVAEHGVPVLVQGSDNMVNVKLVTELPTSTPPTIGTVEKIVTINNQRALVIRITSPDTSDTPRK